MIEAGDRVIAGVSGGADSVCLLFLLWEYQKKVPFSVQAVHVNHQLRGSEAKRDEEYVVRLCRELSVPCRVYSYDVERIAAERHMTVEEAGRLCASRRLAMRVKRQARKARHLPTTGMTWQKRSFTTWQGEAEPRAWRESILCAGMGTESISVPFCVWEGAASKNG